MPRTIAERDARLLAHCCEGLDLARRIPEYRRTVLARLAPEIAAPPDSLWSAVPWIWHTALGGAAPTSGVLAPAVAHLGPSLACALSKGVSAADLDLLFRELCGTLCDAGVVMRSHPFADLRAWSLRTMLGV